MSCVSLENVKVDQQKMKDWHGYSTADKITTVESKTFFSRGDPFFVKPKNETTYLWERWLNLRFYSHY